MQPAPIHSGSGAANVPHHPAVSQWAQQRDAAVAACHQRGSAIAGNGDIARCKTGNGIGCDPRRFIRPGQAGISIEPQPACQQHQEHDACQRKG